MKKITIIALLVIFNFLNLKSQSVEMFYNETSNFPYITTGFKLYDANSNEIRNSGANVLIQSNDILIQEYEYGKLVDRTIVSTPECPEQTQTTFSAILVCDISNSMGDKVSGGQLKIDILREVVIDFIKNFDPKRTEVAITTFAGDAFGHPSDIEYTPFRPFTTDKDSLLLAASYLTQNNLRQGTNWNAAFIAKKEQQYIKNLSALYYTRPNVRKYKPVIIFLTDGNHLPKWDQPGFGGPVQVFTIRQEALENNATIYCIQFGEDDLTDENSQALEELSLVGKAPNDNTSNLWTGINDATTLKNVYQDILIEAGTIGDPPPCYVTWLSGCEGGSATFTFTLPDNSITVGTTEYTIAPNKKPALEITPRNFAFENISPVSKQKQKITLKAIQNFVDLYSIDFISSIRGVGRYVVTDWGPKGPPPFTIEKDSSYQIEIEYTAIDSLFSKALLEVNSSACSGKEFTLQGYMTPFVDTLDCGGVQIGSNKDITFTKAFCNKTGNPIVINSLTLSGSDKNEFEIVDYQPKGTLDTAQCLEVTIKFKPTKEPPGLRITNLKIQTDYNNSTEFSGIVLGEAIGGKTMSSINPGFDSASCNQMTIESTILLENAGNISINISNAEILPDQTNFEIKNNQYPTTIAPAAQEPIVIIFHPDILENNNKTAQLKIESDAENSPYLIDLIGPMRNIDFTVQASLDFGGICVGVPDTQLVNITNTGNVPVTLNLSINSPFKLIQNSITIDVGSNEDIQVICDPSSDGPLSEVLSITNTECNITKTSNISAMGILPDLTSNIDPIVINSTFGSQKSISISLTNNSQSPVQIQSVAAQDGQFVVQNYSPFTPPGNLPPGGILNFDIVYTPTSADSIISTLNITTSTCNYEKIIPLTGAPAQATIDIKIDNFTGYDKKDYDIPIYLENGQNFDNSGTTKITTTIKYDGTLLQADPSLNPTAPDGNGFQTITLSNLSVLPQNTKQELTKIKFYVNKQGTSTQSILDIMNTTGNGGANFNEIDALFSLNPANPKISIDTIFAVPGQETNIIIRMTDTANVNNEVNKNILMNLYFNGALLEPLSSNYILSRTFDKSTHLWKLELQLPAETSNGDILAKIPVKAMLGNDTLFAIYLDSVRVKEGGASFTINNGLFILKGVCIDSEGKARLFDPYVNAAIKSVNPNPAENTINIEFETSEEGFTEIWISDLMGNKIESIYSGIPQQGIHQNLINITNYPNGVYFIIMKTPTQILKDKIYILK